MNLFPLNLSQRQKIAFVMSVRLGDSLLSMVVVNNLLSNGFNVTVFGNYMHSLRALFPAVTIQPLPTSISAREIFSNYDVLLHAYPTDVIGDTAQWHPCIRVLDHSPTYRLRIPMPDIQVEICRRELLLGNVIRTNNLTVPREAIYRKYPKRVVIHPTSDNEEKNWLPQRFLRLAKILQQRGYQPEFIVSPQQRKDWQWLIAQGFKLPEFSNLEAVATWLYESGWFIGNDSGIGHLASNLGIATVTLVIRPGVGRRWRPSWAPGVIVLPPAWLITRPLKQRFWKYVVSVRKVLRAFEQLLEKVSS